MRPITVSALLLSLSPLCGLAEDSLEHVIVTATQQPVSGLDLPLSAAVVNAEDLLIVQEVHPSEIFQRVAGAWISRGNGQESLTAIRSPVLTGAGSCGAFFIASDGISLRAPGFCNVNQLFAANIEQAERIEVLKGPSTALYGSGAMHGLINVITPAPAEVTQHAFGVEAGPHDYRRGKYAFSTRSGAHGFMAQVNATDDGGYKRDSGLNQQKGSLRHQYEQPEFTLDTIFSATDLDQDTAGFIQGYQAYKEASRKKENPNPEAYRKAESQHLQSTASFTLDSGDELLVTPYWRHNRMEFLQHFFPWQPVEKNGHESFGVNSKYYHESTWVKLVSGVDLEATDGWLTEVQAAPFSPNQPQGTHYDYQVDAVAAAAWTQLDWSLARQWSLSAGARFEHTSYDYNNRASDGPACEPTASACRFYRPSDRKDDFNNWSLNAGLLYDYLPDHSAYLRFSRGFRAPETSELYRLQAGQEFADLDSEELDSMELGFKGGYDTLRYELGAYYMNKDNVIFQDANRRNISGAKTIHYGLDVSLRWQFAESLDLAVDGTLARHEYDNDANLLGVSTDIKGNRVDTAPELFGSVRLGWNATPEYRAELEWVHMDNYYLEPENRFEYDGHDLLNLRLQARLSDALSLGLRVTNLADKDYAERADYGFGNYRYFVGEPRSVFANLEYRFLP